MKMDNDDYLKLFYDNNYSISKILTHTNNKVSNKVNNKSYSFKVNKNL